MKQIYQQLEETPTPFGQLELLLKLTQEFLNRDLQRCEETAWRLRELGEQEHMPAAIMHHYLVLGRIYYRKGLLQEASVYFDQAEAIAMEINHHGGLISCLEMNGVVLNQQGKHADALQLFTQALALCKQHNVPNSALGLAYNNIANAYNYLHQLHEAERYYRLAIDTFENTDRKHTINLIKSNLGLMMYKKGQFAEAIEFFQAGLAGFIEQNNVQAQSQSYSHIGHSYLCLQEYANALLYFQKGLKLIRSSNLTNELSSIYHGLGQLYTQMGGNKEALNYLTKALELRLEKSFWASACETYESLHKLYTQMGDTEQAKQAQASGKKLSLEQGLDEWQQKFDALPNDILNTTSIKPL